MNTHYIAETSRLKLRSFTPGDAAFVLALLNTEGWLQFIGDRQVNTIKDAERYIEQKIIASYHSHGFGLYLVEQVGDQQPIGMCGLVKRDLLEDPDIGFAFLPEYTGSGYALEAAVAIKEVALTRFNFKNLYAVTTPGNSRSQNLLFKLGMQFIKSITVDKEELNVYATY